MSELEELFLEGWQRYAGAEPPAPVREWLLDDSGDRKFRLDFAWPELRVAVEIDGDCHRTKGRFVSDIAKHNLCVQLGWSVLRFGRANLTKKLPPQATRGGKYTPADLDRPRREAVHMVLALLRAKSTTAD
mgnify:CR=1 FL=1